MSREEVDGALAPSGALHDEYPRPIVDECLDRLPLPGTKICVRTPREQPQGIEKWVNVEHVAIVHRGCDDAVGQVPCRTGSSWWSTRISRLILASAGRRETGSTGPQ